MIERVLLIVNSASGTGCAAGLPAELLAGLHESCPGLREVELAIVCRHPDAREAAAEFAAGSDGTPAVIAGGGGGTLRAAVEGVIDAGVGETAVLGALRMGSGNVLAKRLGIARDPLTGIRQLGCAVAAERTVAQPVIRCRFGTTHGAEDVRHATLMCGLGQWGRCSGDLARWHRALERGRRVIAAVGSLERLTPIEYMAAAGGRLLEATVRPSACELVDVTYGGDSERYRLLAGTAMTVRIGGIPFDPRVEPGAAAVRALLVPRGGRPRRFRLTPGGPVELTLADRDSVEFFLDEDPEIAHGRIVLDVAARISFLCADSTEVAA